MKTAVRAGVLATAVAALVAISQPASAVTQSCTSGDGKFMASVTDASAKLCLTSQPSYSGGEPIVRTFFDMDYTLSYKSDELSKGDGKVSFTGFVNNDIDADLFGEWSLGDLSGIASVLVGFKKSNDFYALFELEGTSGTWQIKKVDKTPAQVQNSYSHVDIWYKLGGGTTEVPLPASLPLLLAGLAGLGIVTRRRKAA